MTTKDRPDPQQKGGASASPLKPPPGPWRLSPLSARFAAWSRSFDRIDWDPIRSWFRDELHRGVTPFLEFPREERMPEPDAPPPGPGLCWEPCPSWDWSADRHHVPRQAGWRETTFERAMVPGGWLIRSDPGLTFMPDPEHAWDPRSQPGG